MASREQYALTGDDELIINDFPFSQGLTDGDNITIEYPNDLLSVSTGKNKNTIFAKDESGNNVTVTIRTLRGSLQDKTLNGYVNNQNNNFAGFILLNGSFVKKVGDGAGNISYDTYVLRGGMMQTNIGTTSNDNGDTEQGSAVYTITFAIGTRGIF